jgi:2-oxoglutarate ferredoxin oxidoreductase subunit gamma
MLEESIVKFSARFAGWGGQGNILAGLILAQAATIEKKYVVQTQNHGAQQMGGISRSDIIISNSQINFPEAKKFNVLVALNQEVLEKYSRDIKTNHLLILDTTFCDKIMPKVFYMTKKIIAYPFSAKARELFGKEILANIITLGIIARFTDILSYSSITEAVLKKVPPHTVDINKKALQMGYEMNLSELTLNEALNLKDLNCRYLNKNK